MVAVTKISLCEGSNAEIRFGDCAYLLFLFGIGVAAEGILHKRRRAHAVRYRTKGAQKRLQQVVLQQRLDHPASINVERAQKEATR